MAWQALASPLAFSLQRSAFDLTRSPERRSIAAVPAGLLQRLNAEINGSDLKHDNILTRLRLRL
jgi:hypothetical protein